MDICPAVPGIMSLLQVGEVGSVKRLCTVHLLISKVDFANFIRCNSSDLKDERKISWQWRFSGRAEKTKPWQ